MGGFFWFLLIPAILVAATNLTRFAVPPPPSILKDNTDISHLLPPPDRPLPLCKTRLHNRPLHNRLALPPLALVPSPNPLFPHSHKPKRHTPPRSLAHHLPLIRTPLALQPPLLRLGRLALPLRPPLLPAHRPIDVRLCLRRPHLAPAEPVLDGIGLHCICGRRGGGVERDTASFGLGVAVRVFCGRGVVGGSGRGGVGVGWWRINHVDAAPDLWLLDDEAGAAVFAPAVDFLRVFLAVEEELFDKGAVDCQAVVAFGCVFGF